LTWEKLNNKRKSNTKNSLLNKLLRVKVLKLNLQKFNKITLKKKLNKIKLIKRYNKKFKKKLKEIMSLKNQSKPK